MRLHLVSLPHTQVTRAFSSCAYTQKIVKFADMMSAGGHEVILYAGDQCDAQVAELVPLFSEEERAADWGPGFDTVTSPLLWDANLPYWSRMNERAVAAIDARAQDEDLLLVIAGWCQKPISDGVKLSQERRMLTAEWGVGYEGVFSDFIAFESAAWMHHVYGRQGWTGGRFYDAVIPNYFDLDDFELFPHKDDYLLYVGRLIERKGIAVAGQIADRLGMKLLLAGPGANLEQTRPGRVVATDGTVVEGDVEYVGEVGIAERAVLMGKARCLLAPTLYLEPFGGVTIEAMLAGTPVVTTDWGAFSETVTPEVGRRFHTLQEGADAVVEAMRLDPVQVHHHAAARYSLEAVRPRYERWFNQIGGLWNGGWPA